MKIVGMLTEFHPFHSGHAYLFSALREKLGEDTAVVCIMSGNFVQRGEPAMLEKHVRAEAALASGADVVLELPVARCLSSAEGFAHGAVYMMQQTGCITHLAFGSECGDTERLSAAAACLNSEEYRKTLRQFLGGGMSFAVCRQAAVRELMGEETAALLGQANNNLGVEYLKAARRLCWDCAPVTVKRRGAGHDSRNYGEYRSGSAVRSLLLAEDWDAVEAAVPARAAELYRSAFACGRSPVTMKTGERMLLERLRTMEEADFEKLPDCGEGLHHRLYQAVGEAADLEELLTKVKTKRYALSRLRRILMCAWLDIDRTAAEELPQYLRVLGCSQRGRKVLAQMRKTAKLPVLVKPADARTLPEAAQRQFFREARTTEQYTLLYPDFAQSLPRREWCRGPVVLKNTETVGEVE